MRIKLLQNFIDKLRAKPEGAWVDAWFKTKQLMEVKEEITDLYLGLSYGQYGINPAYLTNPSYNLCMPSVDLYYAYKMYSYFCDTLPVLKNIYIATAFYSPGFCLAKSSEKEFLEIYELFCGVKNPNTSFNTLIRKNLTGLWRKKLPDKFINGYDKGHIDFTINADLEARIKSHYKQYSKYGHGQLEWLYKLSVITKLNGHKLFVILFPLSKEYEQELIRQTGFDLKTANSIILEFCTKHNIDVINLSTLKLEKKYFYDGSHLNAHGAEILSKELNKKLQDIV